MVTKIIIFIIILTSSAFANCKNYSNISNDEIKNLQIEIYKEKKFIKHVSKFYLALKKGEILTNYNKKKKYAARVTVNYNNGNYCNYEAKLRMQGDGLDHIGLVNGLPTSSMNIQLKNGNIKNITRFILFKPKTRNNANEIFASSLFRYLGFLSPRTFKINVKIFNNKSEFIFQESLKKEFLEYSNRIEGPILESKEENNAHLKMARISNKEWIKGNKNKYIVSLNAIRDYNFSLLKSYKFRILGANDETVRLDPRDFDEDVFKQISIFDAIMYAIGGAHGLSYDDRRFYYDPIYSKLEPIYFDGDVKILSKIKYDRYTDRFKKKLASWQIIRKPFLNFYLNQNRAKKERYRNPTVTNSAKKGANLAILKLKKINSTILLKELHRNGFQNISIQKLDNLIDIIIERLKLISEAKVYEEKISLEKSLYFTYKNEMKLTTALDLFFINNKSSISNRKELLIEKCDYSLISCESYLINEKKLIGLIEQKQLESNKRVFINFDKSDYASSNIKKSKNTIKNNFKIIKINEFFQIMINKDVEIFFNNKNKVIDLNYLSSKGRAIIYESEIDSWSINMHNLSKKINNKFDNIYNLTGCLTIMDTSLKNINISGESFDCEDTINLIRASGSLNNIQVKNSKSDSLDADFSQLRFNSVNIENSKDDCLDFSYGTYEVINGNFKNCGDKGISVGEKSKATFNQIEVENSSMGLAAKDSSKVYINKANMKNVKVCLSVYKKKQEFNGSFLKVENLNCKIFDKKFDQDDKSILIVENDRYEGNIK